MWVNLSHAWFLNYGLSGNRPYSLAHSRSLSGPNLVSHLLQSPRAVVLAAAALAAAPAADELVEAAAAAVTAA